MAPRKIAKALTPEVLLRGNYLEKNAIVSDVIPSLKALLEHLRGQRQAISDDERELYTPIAEALARPHVHQLRVANKQEELRALVSSCLAQVMRLCAPSSPFSDRQLKGIFQRFLALFSTLDQPKSPTFDLVTQLVGTLAEVKSYMLVIDLDIALIRKTFETFFSVYDTDVHSSTDTTNMLDIMSLCVNALVEDDEPLDEEILGIILRALIDASDDGRRQHELAKMLVSRCASSLQNPCTHFLMEAMRGDATSVLGDSYHEIIHALYSIAPVTVLYVVPQLENEIRGDNQALKLAALRTIRRMFNETPSMCVQHSQLASAFLEQGDHSSSDVRLEVAKVSGTILTNVGPLASEVRELLKRHIVDKHEAVRAKAVSAICKAATASPSSVSADLLACVGERIADTKAKIREAAIHGLATLYNIIDMEDIEEREYEAKFGWIPAKLFSCHAIADWQLRFAIEAALLNLLLPYSDEKTKEQNVETRAEELLVLTTPDIGTLRNYVALVERRQKFRTAFSEYLELAAKEKVNFMSNEMSPAMERKLEELSLHFPLGQTHFDKFVVSLTVSTKTKEFLKCLSTIASPTSPLEEVMKAHEKALAMNKRSKEGKLFEAAFVTKLAMADIVPGTIPKVFSYINSLMDELNHDEEVSSDVILMLKFLEETSTLVPDQFSACLPAIKSLIDEKDTNVKKIGIKILANCDSASLHSSKALLKNVSSTLESLCENGTPSQAKHSTRALFKVSGASAEKKLSALVDNLSNYLMGKTSSNLETILTSLGSVAKLCPLAFKDCSAIVTDFVMGTLLRRRQGGTVYPRSTKVCGVHLIRRYAQSLDMRKKDERNELQAIIQTMVDLLEESDMVEAVERERSYVREAAAIGLLKIARAANQLITSDQFVVLACVTKDPCLEVRQATLKELGKGCIGLKLSLRYLAMLGLMLLDPDKDVYKEAKEALGQSVKTRRQLQQKMKMRNEASHSTLVPENALPHFLFLLTHVSPDLMDSPSATAYQLSGKYLQGFLERIKSAASTAFQMQLLRVIKRSKVASSPQSSGLQILCDISMRIIRNRSPQKGSSQAAPSRVSLPPYFQVVTGEEGTQMVMQNYLPDKWQLASPSQRRSHPLGCRSHHCDPYSRDRLPIKRKARTPSKSPKKRKASKSPKQGRRSPTATPVVDSPAQPQRRSTRSATVRRKITYEELDEEM